MRQRPTLRMNRRSLLKAGVAFGAVAVFAGGGVRWLVSDRPAAPGRVALSDREAKVVFALAEAHFPANNALGVSAWDVPVVALADAYLASLLAADRRLFRALLTAFDFWPRTTLQSSHAFHALSVDERVEILRAFENSGRNERRFIASLLRTLVGMPFFEDPRTWAAVSYAPACAVFEGAP